MQVTDMVCLKNKIVTFHFGSTIQSSHIENSATQEKLREDLNLKKPNTMKDKKVTDKTKMDHAKDIADVLMMIAEIIQAVIKVLEKYKKDWQSRNLSYIV